jgi:hypothetical protein
MSDYLFDTPWWLLILLVITGGTLFYYGNARLDKTLKRVGLSIIGIAVVLFITSWLIDTPKEKVTRNTKNFVKAVVARDTGALDKLLSPRVSIGTWDKQSILKGVKDYADQFGLKSAHITGMNISDNENVIVVHLAVFSDHDSPAVAVPTVNSKWEFDWEDTEQGWLLRNINCEGVGSMDGDAAQRRYFDRLPTK